MIGSLSYSSPWQADWSSSQGTAAKSRTDASADILPQGQMSALYTSLDTDRSGAVSSTELQSYVDGLDSKTLGTLLSLQEQATVASSGATSTDGTDTTTTTATSSDVVSTLMAALDTDGDGSVTETELTDTLASSAPPPPPPLGGRPGGPSGPPPSGETGSTGSTASFSDIDSDGDGSISESEYEAWASASTSTASTSTDTTTGTTTSDGVGTTAAVSTDYAAIMAQLLMRSYAQTDTSLTSTLLSSVDTAA